MLFCFSQNNAFASLETYSISDRQINAGNLNNTLKSSGFVLNLKQNEVFTSQGLEILATSDSYIYISGSDRILTAAILNGTVRDQSNKIITPGEVYIYNQNTNKTILENFDIEHFLNRNASLLPIEVENKILITAKNQNRKKSLGLLKSNEKQGGASEEIIQNIVSSLQSQDISNIIIDNQTMDLSQFETFVIEQNLPLHILISWGATVSDLDIHLTGPQETSRFHIFYLNTGDLQNEPKAAIIDDCISTNCSEVIRINELNKGGVYRASVYNFGDQDINSNSLSSSDIEIEVIRGGTYIENEGDTDFGSTVSGGQSIFKGSPTAGQNGNTWQAIEIDPNNGNVDFINRITNFNNSVDVE